MLFTVVGLLLSIASNVLIRDAEKLAPTLGGDVSSLHWFAVALGVIVLVEIFIWCICINGWRKRTRKSIFYRFVIDILKEKT